MQVASDGSTAEGKKNAHWKYMKPALSNQTQKMQKEKEIVSNIF